MLRVPICLTSIACFLYTQAFAHQWEAQEVDPIIIHASGPLPDRVVLTWNGDPSTSQCVTWRTDVSVEHGIAQLAVASDNGRAMEPITYYANSQLHAHGPYEAHFHTVVFEELQPDTLYAYRVGDGVNWTEYYHFRTATSSPSPFSFIYFGDAQNEIKTHWSRVFRDAFREAPDAAFIVHAGDLINRANNDAEWGEWFGAAGWVNGTIPIIATPGNHEYFRDHSPEEHGQPAKWTLSRQWRPQFEFPIQDTPEGLEETCYYIDYQGTRIISLNTNQDRAAQVPWLRNVLENNPNRWTILTFHTPVFSPVAGRDNPEIRELWKPLMDEFKVDLVLTGHDHTYARTGQMENASTIYEQTYDPEIGTVCVVSVSGPKMYQLEENDWAVSKAENTQLFQIIHVNEDELRFEARTATNQLYDSFTLRKREGKANLLIEDSEEL